MAVVGNDFRPRPGNIVIRIWPLFRRKPDPWYQDFPFLCTRDGMVMLLSAYLIIVATLDSLVVRSLRSFFSQLTERNDREQHMATNETYSFVSDNVTTTYENAYKYATELAANFSLPTVPPTNLTISDALSSNLTNSTGLGPATDNELDETLNLALLISTLLFLALAAWPFVRFYKRALKIIKLYDAKYEAELLDNYRVNPILAGTIQSRKRNFTRSRDPSVDCVVRPEEFGIHSVTSAYVKIERFYISQEVSATLEDFMLADWRRTDGCQFYLDAIVWVYDLLKAVCTMHERGFYHLDLQPKIVGLNWYRYRYRSKWLPNKEWVNIKNRIRSSLIGIPSHDYRELTDPVVVLKQLSKATRCPGNLLESARVGSDDFYKPPECFRMNLVDPDKVDAWGIGITAFEILTGGYLAIKCQLEDPPIRSAAEFLHGRSYRILMSAGIEANFNLIDNFLCHRRYIIKNNVYNLDHTMFMTDCWNFISRLLCEDPNRRESVRSALNLPLMQRVLKKNNPFFINVDSLDA